ncbi:hypothetical protein K9K77_03045 [Candidatus Babeliales bacterium]|nr:hypothetical protein [Candidatus Babeliales bacterium]
MFCWTAEVVRLLLATKEVAIRNVCYGRTAYSVANGAIKELIKQYAAQEDKTCGVCLDDFKKDQALHFSDCCQKAIHLHCAVRVSQSVHNVCVHCNLPPKPLNSFLYKGDTVDAATQTEGSSEAAAAVAIQEENDILDDEL